MADTTVGALPGPDQSSAAFRRALISRPEQMAQTILELHRPVRTEDELMELLSAAVHLSVRFVPHVDWCSVTTQLGGAPLTAAYTDPRALAVDDGQYAFGDGPCLLAMRTQERVSLSATEVGRRWPGLAEAAESTGIGSCQAAPLSGDPIPRGSLNLYGPIHRGMDEDTEDFLTVLEEFLDHGLADYAALRSADLQVAQLSTAMSSRAVIEQAKGILMAVHQIPATEAFAMLSTQSQERNIKLRDVAAKFVQAHTAHPVNALSDPPGSGSFSEYHSAFNHAPIGIAITDVNGTLLLGNPALATLLHASADDLIGSPLADRVHPRYADAAQQAIAELLAGGPAIAGHHTRLRRADGTIMEVLASAAVIRNGDHSPSHLAVYHQDITTPQNQPLIQAAAAEEVLDTLTA